MNQKQVLRCLGPCGKKFSEQDVEDLNFFPSISTCYTCCDQLRQKPINVDCFGKETSYGPGGKILGYAYDPSATDCRLHCELRSVCKHFVSGKIDKMRSKLQLEQDIPFQQDSLMFKVFKKCLKGTTKNKIRRIVEAEAGDVKRIFRILRSERFERKSKTVKWIYDEDGKYIKVSYK